MCDYYTTITRCQKCHQVVKVDTQKLPCVREISRRSGKAGRRDEAECYGDAKTERRLVPDSECKACREKVSKAKEL
ncbi:hypothetical protein ACJ41O_010951 [Fusarium nematophilum]